MIYFLLFEIRGSELKVLLFPYHRPSNYVDQVSFWTSQSCTPSQCNAECHKNCNMGHDRDCDAVLILSCIMVGILILLYCSVYCKMHRYLGN